MIKITGLTKKYGSNTIFNNLDIVFPANKVNFILGKNGIGKTTLYKCILKLEAYEGKIINENDRTFCIYDEQPFYLHLTGIENIELFKMFYGIKNETVMDNPIMELSLLKKKVKKYSYGERKKLALLMVDIIKPNLLLLDEVSNGLDYETIKYFKDKIEQWKISMTIIATGHQLDFYNSVVENVFIVKDKNIMLIDAKSQCLEDIYEEYIS